MNEKYRGGIFVAAHGSWNRTTPSTMALEGGLQVRRPQGVAATAG